MKIATVALFRNRAKCSEDAAFCAQKTLNLSAVAVALLLALFVTLRCMFVPLSPRESAPAAANRPGSGRCALMNNPQQGRSLDE
ncbi:hypothetical protein [Acidovorax sp.]|uniref:hypothetical protein n=1 Tax=Acidovorax sp. TaxID=1872122 RepID=UPI00262D55ED|nr:hypothetical protein [Acidovorax sp.]